MSKSTLKSFLKGSVVLTASVGLAGLLNYFFNIIVGRKLGPAEYSGFVAVLSILYIFSVPALTVQTTTAKFVNEKEDVVSHLSRLIFYFAFSATILLLVFSKLISAQLKIDDHLAVIFGILCLIPTLYSPLIMGQLQAKKKFWGFGLVSLISPITKVILIFVLAYISLTLRGSIFAVLISVILAFAIGYLIFPFNLKLKKASGATAILINNYLKTTTVAFAFFTLMVNIDIIAVKYFLSSELAGNYAAVSTLGKTLLFITQPIAWVMFPLLTELIASQKKHYKVLLMTMTVTALISFALYLATLLWPTQIISVAFGKDFQFAPDILSKFTLAMFFYALNNVWLNYFLAAQKKGAATILTSVAIAELVLILIFHQNLSQVVNSVIAVMVVGFVAFCLTYLADKLRPKAI